MNPPNPNSLVDGKVNVKVKLASLWTALMFLYIYADYFELMTEGAIEKIMNLESPLIPVAITPWSLVYSTIMLAIPALMVCLCTVLQARFNRWANIIVAIPYAIISILIIYSGIGNEWQAFFVLFNVVELFVFASILWLAWSWPREDIRH